MLLLKSWFQKFSTRALGDTQWPQVLTTTGTSVKTLTLGIKTFSQKFLFPPRVCLCMGIYNWRLVMSWTILAWLVSDQSIYKLSSNNDLKQNMETHNGHTIHGTDNYLLPYALTLAIKSKSLERERALPCGWVPKTQMCRCPFKPHAPGDTTAFTHEECTISFGVNTDFLQGNFLLQVEQEASDPCQCKPVPWALYPDQVN